MSEKSSLVHRPNIPLRTLAFGFTQSEVHIGAVTIAEMLPLCPSRINGNVGRKYKSQATQLGQNLSHIDAYNGEKGTCGSITHVRGLRPGYIIKLL